MEIIEKQVEKVKEVPADNYGYNYGRRDINGKANAGLTLGIIGTALGAWALFGGRRSASLLGGTGTGSGADANIAIATCGGSANGVNAPTAFQAWEKECEDTLALQAGIYNLAMTYQNNRFADRQQLNSELFSAWKSQIDADFGLYKSTRDGFDVLSAKQNQDAFNLYKSQRDSDDEIRKELSDLKAQVTIMQLTDNLKSYISSQLESMSKSSPVIGFMKPLITRALDKNFSKITKALELIADKDGNVDVEGILTEMMENLMTTNPFSFKTSFIGDIEIGGGQIKFNSRNKVVSYFKEY